ncbi:hypothetical protein ACTG9Q_02985 [Actinokineospora sp. 24-640]
MRRHRAIAALLTTLALATATACGPTQEPAAPNSSIESDLQNIETTLDSIESDLNGE